MNSNESKQRKKKGGILLMLLLVNKKLNKYLQNNKSHCKQNIEYRFTKKSNNKVPTLPTIHDIFFQI